MSRNIKEQQKKIFNILHDLVPEDMKGKISNKKREVEFSEKTYDIVASADYICSKSFPENALGLVKYDSHTYICAKEFKESFVYDQTKYISEQEILDGIGVLMFIDGMITVNEEQTGYAIFDRFFGFEEDRRYECEVLFEVIQNYVVFEFDDQDIDIRYMEDLERLSYMLYFENFSEKIELYSDIYHILELNSSKCIVSILGNIAKTNGSSNIFLQLYRCLEYLFIICKALEFFKKHELQDELSKIVLVLDEEKIRFAENGCLHLIIDKYVTSEIINEYYNYVDKNVRHGETTSENKVQTVCDYIYSTRCKIAHYKYGQEEIFDSGTLQESIIILCKLVKSVFEKLDDVLMEINTELGVFSEIEFMKNME